LEIPAYAKLEPSPDPNRAGTPPVLSIVIPAYNEAGRIGAYLGEIIRYLSNKSEPFEILVVDDGSLDGTGEVVRRARGDCPQLFLLSYLPNRGKGHAVRVGMLAARGEVRLFTDADGSTPIQEIEKLRERMAQTGCEVAIGSRALPDPTRKRIFAAHRWAMGQVFRFLRQVLLPIPVADSQCGFKLFTASAARTLFGAARLDGWAFDAEVLFRAHRRGMRIEEVPVSWHDSRDSRVRFLSDPIRMIAEMWRVRRLARAEGQAGPLTPGPGGEETHGR
jgi:dolichyl-phosphate beta-glucosyltransferase